MSTRYDYKQMKQTKTTHKEDSHKNPKSYDGQIDRITESLLNICHTFMRLLRAVLSESAI